MTAKEFQAPANGSCTTPNPRDQIRAYAKEFNPVKFNATNGSPSPRRRGMKYIVITSKHHDGFAMFGLQASDWNIVKATPFGRDPLKELAAACQKQGSTRLLLFAGAGLEQSRRGGRQRALGPAQDGSMDDYIRNIARRK